MKTIMTSTGFKDETRLVYLIVDNYELYAFKQEDKAHTQALEHARELLMMYPSYFKDLGVVSGVSRQDVAIINEFPNDSAIPLQNYVRRVYEGMKETPSE